MLLPKNKNENRNTDLKETRLGFDQIMIFGESAIFDGLDGSNILEKSDHSGRLQT